MQDQLCELTFLLSNVANNMNQMAHHSNRLREVFDEQGVMNAFGQMEAMLHNFVSQRLSAP